jgi:CHAT domain-containing protein/tetratricopeptide (TPR) repeat protein
MESLFSYSSGGTAVLLASLYLLSPRPAVSAPLLVSEILGNEFRPSLEQVRKLENQAEESLYRGDYAKALQTLETALKITEASFGTNHNDIALVLNGIAMICIDQGDLDKADLLLGRSLAIGKAATNTKPSAVAQTLGLKGKLQLVRGHLDEAELLHQRSLATYEKAYGADHLSVALCLNELGDLYVAQERHVDAIRILERSLLIENQVLGPEHPIVAFTMSVLSQAHHGLGRFDEATRCAERSLAIREKSLGRSHPGVAESLAHLAQACVWNGDYARAEVLLRRSLAILEETWGTDHRNVAICLDKLSEVYEHQGEYSRATALLARSWDIKKRVCGEDDPLVADSLAAWADLQQRCGNREQALKGLLVCLQIRRKAFGDDAPLVGDTLEKAGSAFQELGDLSGALASFERALEIREAALGTNHPNVAVSLAHIASLCDRLGDYDTSAKLQRRGLSILEAAYGPDHPDVATTKQQLSFTLARQGELGEALLTGSAGFEKERNYLVGQLTGVTKAIALRQVGNLFSSAETFHSVCGLAAKRGIAVAPVLGAEQLAFNKALLEEVEATQAELDVAPGSRLKGLRTRYGELQFQLARLPDAKLSLEARAAKRRSLRDEASRLEAQLAEDTGAVGQMLRERKLTLASIAVRLPEESVLLDFARYRRFDFTPKTNDWREARYAVYLSFGLARASTNPVVRLADLGEAAPIDEAVGIVVGRMSAGQYRAKDLQAALERLSQSVYAPLARHLTNVSHLIICPDGQLGRLPFEMLPVGPNGRFLVEDKTISYVTSGREVARLAQPSAKVKTSAPVVMGNPDFDLRLDHEKPLQLASLKTEGARGQAPEIGATNLGSFAASFSPSEMRSLSQSYRGFSFPPLPGSENEARAAARLLGTNSVLRLGREASEAALKGVVSPRVLHLATHGFFLSDQEFKRTNRAEDFLVPSSGFAPRRFNPESDWENPMIRCGIALAGANHASRITNGLAEDGLLTALEASLLNLQGTELVILSACDTGTGEVKIGEGVMSLRRAFRIAGAETVLASHWRVSDAATRQLMTEFIRRWQSGEPRARAWREAQLSLLRSKDYSSPYFWAAFTLTGQWR